MCIVQDSLMSNLFPFVNNIIVTADERRERNASKAPYFLVALKDTEILENTYLRFMVKVKGDPNPEVKL